MSRKTPSASLALALLTMIPGAAQAADAAATSATAKALGFES